MGLMLLRVVVAVVVACQPLIILLYRAMRTTPADNNTITNKSGRSNSSQKEGHPAKMLALLLLPRILEVRKTPISVLSFILFNTRITGTTH
jgi:hypothetical protein